MRTLIVGVVLFLLPGTLLAAGQDPPPRSEFNAGIGISARTIRSHQDLLAIQREEVDHQRAGFMWRLYLADPKKVYPTPLVQLTGGFGVAARGSEDTGRGYIWDGSLGMGAHARVTRWAYLTPMAGVQIQSQQYDRLAGRREMSWKGLWLGLEGTIDGLPRWEFTGGGQYHWSDLEQEVGGTTVPSNPFHGLVLNTKVGYQVTSTTGLSLTYQRARWQSKKGGGQYLELDSDEIGVNLDVRF